MKPIFTTWRDDPGAVYLKTGYRQFESRFGVSGLAKVRAYHLDIVAVLAAQPGSGQFRDFIAACKLKFDSVTIWQIFNPFLPAVLLRYGFKPTGPVPEDATPGAELIEGFRWES